MSLGRTLGAWVGPYLLGIGLYSVHTMIYYLTVHISMILLHHSPFGHLLFGFAPVIVIRLPDVDWVTTSH